MCHASAVGFDAELHLRLLGERELIGGVHEHERSLGEVAQALLAVGEIDLDTAGEVVEDYELAAALREPGRGPARRKAGGGSPARPPAEPLRVAACGVTLQRPTEEVEVRTVTFTASETRVSVVVRARGGGGPSARRRPGPTPRFGQLADDRGTTARVAFSGAGFRHELRGELTATTPLAVDTAWLELDGARIELAERAEAGAPTVESLVESPGGEALRYLWHLLATPRWPDPPLDLEAIVEALTAAGRLRGCEPQLEAVRQVREHVRAWWSPHSGPPGAGGARGAALEHAPPEWRALLSAPGRGRGARGRIGVGALTPIFDGVRVLIHELTADEEGWRLEVDVLGRVGFGHLHGGWFAEPRLAWWAVDDLGGHHLARSVSSSSSRIGWFTGIIEFGSRLDRTAGALTLLPTGPTERARIEVPLRWEPA